MGVAFARTVCGWMVVFVPPTTYSHFVVFDPAMCEKGILNGFPFDVVYGLSWTSSVLGVNDFNSWLMESSDDK